MGVVKRPISESRARSQARDGSKFAEQLSYQHIREWANVTGKRVNIPYMISVNGSQIRHVIG